MKTFKIMALYLFAAGFFLAGVAHFIYDTGFAAMLPDFVPFKLEVVYVTAIIEWMLSLFLIFPQTRRLAGIATAIFLLAVLPANIYAAIHGIPAPWSEETNLTALWIRPLFQPLLIWWVLAVSK
ncbi:hypothetical protein LF817_10725 [Halobacillus sp. A1]|uniref:DoxX family protein n=1 Tax=Halobacillus campisalis TaxID=435909 RepID=A0ABW2K324_9BACI|nr:MULTISPECIES: hypothetical protein [Halobacillus]MCP3031817.1 hypothetical protein [Halobacillus sp. A1]